ncbi:glycosyltransferase [Alicyclobacillus acidiphilus]|uniref:glycosyltransferase n=1 Tax=Alicyclobacillus acidiphilus TaxID=182455 RepID=UPI000A5D8A57|nr:glycosyltransferase [Alicyclobacillus acidiphilus]
MLSLEPKVAIITRTKNRTVLLRRAIESVLRQDYQNWVHVIVNDGGISSEVDWLVEHYQSEYQGRVIVVHHDESRGMEAASNAGINATQSELLVIHDDDDSWAPAFLSTSVAELITWQQRIPSVQGVVTHCHRVLERIEGQTVIAESIEDFNQWMPPGIMSLDRMMYDNIFPPISFLFTRAAWNQVQGFREDLPVLGDWEFNVRFLVQYDIVVCAHNLAFYHLRPNSTGALGNSVIDGVSKHHFYRQALLNEWLRDDLRAGKMGIGVYSNLRSHFAELMWRGSGAPHIASGSDHLPFKVHDLDAFWNSKSWRMTRPLRNLRLRIRGLPKEEKPHVGDDATATAVILEMLRSTSWDAMGPLRVGTSILRKLFRSAR